MYHRTGDHRTEFCADLRKVLSAPINETVTQNPPTNREPQKPQSPERPRSVNVITNLDTAFDPITTIQPINEPEPDLTNDQQMSNPVLDLNPDDDELPADYFENYDMHGRLYVNKKLQKKIIAHRRIQEARQTPPIPTPSEPRINWKPKRRKPKYKVLKKVMAASDIPSFIQNTAAELTGLKISEPVKVCPDDDWPISSPCDLPHVSLTNNMTKVCDPSFSCHLSQVLSGPDQPKKKSA